MATNKDQYVYFLYSETQNKERTAIEKKLSRTFTPGVVIVNGKRNQFTEMSKKDSNRYVDCKIVAEGWRSKMIFTPISVR